MKKTFRILKVFRFLAALAVAAIAFSGPPAGAKTPADAGKVPKWIGPYLQNPAPDAMTVCFLASVGGGEVSVLHGADELKNELKAVGTPVPGTPWTVWKARITGLKPGAKHRYRVEWRGGGSPLHESEETTFATPDPGAGRVRMIVVNDIHNRVGTLEALMRHVRPEDYEFSVLLGDCWTDPNPKDGASKVFRTFAAYVRLLDAAAKPMLFVRGNHETRGGFADRMAMLFDIPGLDATRKKDEQQWWYSFRDGPVFFIAADTGEDDEFATPEKSYKRPKFWQSYRKRQTPWLEGLFKKNAAGDAAWTIFLSHIPLYNPAGWNSEPSRVYWEPALRKGKIDLMCAGHIHKWQLVPKGKSWSRTIRPKDGPKKKETRTAPWPVLIGGGPAEKQGTVMLVEATRKRLSVRLLDAKGKVLTKFSEEKGKSR